MTGAIVFRGFLGGFIVSNQKGLRTLSTFFLFCEKFARLAVNTWHMSQYGGRVESVVWYFRRASDFEGFGILACFGKSDFKDFIGTGLGTGEVVGFCFFDVEF